MVNRGSHKATNSRMVYFGAVQVGYLTEVTSAIKRFDYSSPKAKNRSPRILDTIFRSSRFKKLIELTLILVRSASTIPRWAWAQRDIDFSNNLPDFSALGYPCGFRSH